MTKLLEIEAAAEALPPEQKLELFRFLAAHLRSDLAQPQKARLVRKEGDALLEAPTGAPPMTPENVKRMLEDWAASSSAGSAGILPARATSDTPAGRQRSQ